MPAFASRFGRALLPLVLALSGAVALDASAQPKDPTDQARELAREGWKALDAQNYKDALDKVTQAEALYHAPTHLLLMGNALAGLKRLAEALAVFERLAAEPLSAAAPPPFKEAQDIGRKRMKELLSRVPSMLVVVENVEATGAVITVDGQKASFEGGLAVRFDPGEHTIGVEAEGFAPLKKKIVLPEKGGVVRVPITLEKPHAGGSASASVSAAASASASGSAGPDQPPNRVPAFVAFGVAGAGILAGAVTGGLSLSATGDLKPRCPNNVCSPSDKGALDSANALANASTATFILGGVAAAAGVVLLVVDFGGKKSKPASGARIEPWISAGGAGLRGSF